MFRVPRWVKGLSTSLSSINMAYARPSTEIIGPRGVSSLGRGVSVCGHYPCVLEPSRKASWGKWHLDFALMDV